MGLRRVQVADRRMPAEHRSPDLVLGRQGTLLGLLGRLRDRPGTFLRGWNMTEKPTQTVTITLAAYESLVRDRKMLRHLEANGVDNWEGYSSPFVDKEDEEDDDAMVA